ncbi:MAG: tRNA pseudouridine(38-40) synthase TruA [Gemmatimonadaceae bacterium]|nr:tRNA pseudouridine(38-40) synthase TruA [Chitinophagaceae bacterium]
MQRYFLELMYMGTAYSGFQVQENASTVQAEVEKAFTILQRDKVEMTGSSRTDAHVHALQNYFHFDYDGDVHPQFVYKMNAILPKDIVIKSLMPVNADAHCRFDVSSRTYHYHIYRKKNPFLSDTAHYYPFKMDFDVLKKVAEIIKEYEDFTSFSKRNTQVKTFNCEIFSSEWAEEAEQLIYKVRANRFLRGMVRGLTGTMLQAGRGRISIDDFRKIIESKDCRNADFAVPGKGLFLVNVELRLP